MAGRFSLAVLLCVTSIVAAILDCDARAGVRREDYNDIDEGDYIVLASRPEFDAVGKIEIVDSRVWKLFGSAVLIDSRWVLTAGHIVDDASKMLRFSTDSATYSISEFFAHPNYVGPNWLNNGYDIGLIRLTEPVPNTGTEGVIPAVRFAGASEIGATATIVGYGQGGEGDVGFTTDPSGIKRRPERA